MIKYGVQGKIIHLDKIIRSNKCITRRVLTRHVVGLQEFKHYSVAYIQSSQNLR